MKPHYKLSEHIWIPAIRFIAVQRLPSILVEFRYTRYGPSTTAVFCMDTDRIINQIQKWYNFTNLDHAIPLWVFYNESFDVNLAILMPSVSEKDAIINYIRNLNNGNGI